MLYYYKKDEHTPPWARPIEDLYNGTVARPITKPLTPLTPAEKALQKEFIDNFIEDMAGLPHPIDFPSTKTNEKLSLSINLFRLN